MTGLRACSSRRRAVMTSRYSASSFYPEPGGRKAMIESPLYQEVVAESKCEGARTQAKQQCIIKVLVNRFGDSAKTWRSS